MAKIVASGQDDLKNFVFGVGERGKGDKIPTIPKRLYVKFWAYFLVARTLLIAYVEHCGLQRY